MMTFTPTQKELFNKNIEALSNILLKESLKEIKSSKFELILGKDNLDINLKDTSDNTFLYENVIDELNSMLNTYNDKYLLYPVFFSARLMILENDKLQTQDYTELCSNKPFFQFSRIYFLELMSHYYERFHEDILGLNKKLAENFKNSIVSHGNDPLDALQGIPQIYSSCYKAAIIVSTGPSLTKQLPF